MLGVKLTIERRESDSEAREEEKLNQKMEMLSGLDTS